MSATALELTPTESPAGGEPPRLKGQLFVRPVWEGEEGVKNLMKVAIPLILACATHSVNMFFDRTFLAWYSADAFTAALQSGVLHWAIISFAFHVVIYTSTFVAQYKGAGEEQRIGAVIWQGVYLAFVSGVALMALAPIGYPLFRWVGHAGDLPLLEAQYFAVLALGTPAILLNVALSCHFTGRGKTNLVLFVNACSCLLNICLNVWMIFDEVWIFPNGMQGAAWASIMAAFVGAVLFAAFIAAEKNAEERFRVFSAWRFDWRLTQRILRFGIPSGVHAVMDVLGFTSFLLVVGVFGYTAQQATNMAMNVNILFFIPAVGMHQAVQILAGQLCGGNRRGGVEKMVSGAMVITLGYMLAVCSIYLFLPHLVVDFFRGGMPEEQWQEVFGLAKMLLVVVAAYSLFDAIMLIYNGVLKGSGDTTFVMWTSAIFSTVFFLIPCSLLAIYADQFENPRYGLYACWATCTSWITFLAILYTWRYRGGKWKNIQMIEHDAPDSTVVVAKPESPEHVVPAV